MSRNFLIAAVLVPLVCFLLFKFQDGDFTLMIYEKIGQDPAVALRGKVVWITGASSGIGEYLAYELVKYGCKLVLSARRKAELERVKKNCAGMVKRRGQNGFAFKHVALINTRISVIVFKDSTVPTKYKGFCAKLGPVQTPLHSCAEPNSIWFDFRATLE